MASRDHWTWLNLTKILDKRFAEDSLEQNFKQTLLRPIEFRLTLLQVIVATLYVVIYSRAADFRAFVVADPVHDPQFNDTRTLWVVLVALWLAPSIVWLAFILSKRQCECLKSLDVELLATFAVSVRSLVSPWRDSWIVARIFNQNPSEVWIDNEVGNEGDIALAFVITTTLWSLFFPVRIHLKWIPCVIGSLSFMLRGLAVDSPFPKDFWFRSFAIWMHIFFSLCGASNVEEVARANFLAQMSLEQKSREFEVQQASTSRVLHRLTDAVLHLDSNCTILDVDCRFSALLMRASAEVTVGNNFCDYLASDEDRDRFLNSLRERESTHASAESAGQMTLLRFRDSYGHDFAMHAYHASHFLADGKCGHTVALVESQERERRCLEETCAEGQNADASLRESDHESDCSSFSTACDLAEVAVWVDAASVELNIVKCTAGFSIFRPLSVGSSFVAAVGRDASKKVVFWEWFQAQINCGLGEEKCENRPLNVVLFPSADAKVEYKAKCNIRFDLSEDHDDYELGLVCLVLDDVKCRRSQSSRRRQQPSLIPNDRTNLLRL